MFELNYLFYYQISVNYFMKWLIASFFFAFVKFFFIFESKIKLWLNFSLLLEKYWLFLLKFMLCFFCILHPDFSLVLSLNFLHRN